MIVKHNDHPNNKSSWRFLSSFQPSFVFSLPSLKTRHFSTMGSMIFRACIFSICKEWFDYQRIHVMEAYRKRRLKHSKLSSPVFVPPRRYTSYSREDLVFNAIIYYKCTDIWDNTMERTESGFQKSRSFFKKTTIISLNGDKNVKRSRNNVYPTSILILNIVLKRTRMPLAL